MMIESVIPNPPRCLFYQVELILFYFQQLQKKFSKKSHEIQQKWSKICNVQKHLKYVIWDMLNTMQKTALLYEV